MAHEVESMFSVRAKPWHGLGRILTKFPTAREAQTAAGLDWEVRLEELHADARNYGLATLHVPVKTHKAVMRSTDGAVLGVVGEDWRPIQNRELFDTAEALRIDGGIVEYETAGSLRGGAVVWLLCRLPGGWKVLGQDAVEPYCAITVAHDGSRALRMFPTPVRIVCMNTMRQALSRRDAGKDGMTRGVSVVHRGDVKAKLAAAKRALQLIMGQTVQLREASEAMAAKRVTLAEAEAYWRAVAPAPIGPDPAAFGSSREEHERFDKARAAHDRAMAKWADTQRDMRYVFTGQTGTVSGAVAGTMWAAYNAATEALQQGYGYDEILFGAVGGRTERALELALT